MKQIIKKISIEPSISRAPGILPALNNKWVLTKHNFEIEYDSYSEAKRDAINGGINLSNIEEEIGFVDYSDNKILSSNTNGNYGLIVSDIEIPHEFVDKITDYTDIYINIPKGEYDYYTINQISKRDLLNRATSGETYYFYYGRDIYSVVCDEKTSNDTIENVVSGATMHKYLTYNTLHKWFADFKNYYNLLRGGTKNIVYENAMEYYKYEIEPKTAEKEKIYKSYDDTFKARGGKEFFDWVIKNCFPTYYIPSKFVDSLGCGYLYYPNALKLYSWLKARYLKYNELLEHSDKYTFTIKIESATTAFGMESSADTKMISDFIDKISSDNFIYTSESNTFDPNASSFPKIKATPKRGLKKDWKEICLSRQDCCDCSEYFKKGGNELYYDLDKWIKRISKFEGAINSATITIPISISTNIDDLGQFSIFSNEYKEKVSYDSTLSADQTQDGLSGGTVIHRPVIRNEKNGNVFVDNNSYMIKTDHDRKGYKINQYKESVFNTDDWVDYTAYYVNKHSNEFVSNSLYMAYKRDGGIVFNPTNEKMVEKYDVILYNYGFIYFNDEIYPVERSKYVVYSGLTNSLLNGKLFKVDETEDKEYITRIGDNTYYASRGIDGKLAFNFMNISKCATADEYTSKVLPVDDFTYTVSINNTVYLIEDDDTFTIDNEGTNVKCPKFDSYVDIDGERYYVKGRKLYRYKETNYIYNNDSPSGFTQSGQTEIFDKIETEGNNEYIDAESGFIVSKRFPNVSNNEVEVLFPYKRFRCDTVSGHTDSKLSNFKQTRILTDDLGNEMPGYCNLSNAVYPKEGTVLDLNYKVGNISNLSMNNRLTVEDDYKSQYFDGDILDSMEIFCTVNGEKYSGSVIALSNSMETSKKTDVLGAIASATTSTKKYVSKLYTKGIENVIGKNYSIKGIKDDIVDEYSGYSVGIYCTFTYYIGAILHEKINRNNDGTYTYDGYELASGKNHGVRYQETDELVLNNCTYNLIDGNKIILKYYDIIPNQRTVTLNAYDNQTMTVDDAVFTAYIRMLQIDKNDGSVIVTRNEFSPDNGFNQMNNTIATPVFRKEYNFGISLPQNVSSDIYIDRGINKAFDKHIRLQEVKTMDALEQYQNGLIFNIIDS